MSAPIKRQAGNPWVSSSDEVAHPASPRGGGGPGSFSIPGAAGVTSPPFGLPDPHSTAGRFVLYSDLAQRLLAQNDTVRGRNQRATDAAAPLYPVTLKEFNNKGAARYVDAVKGQAMGVHPKGNFAWVNAVEVVFAIDSALAHKMKITGYRARQNIHSMEMWQRELKDGALTPWKNTVSAGVAPDDPAEGLVTTTRSSIAYHDAPGFMAAKNEVQFSGPNDIKTSKGAVYILLRQNFIGWIDGATGKSGGKHEAWQRVSEEVRWHSNQSMARDIFSKDEHWIAVDGCEIELEHTQGPPR